MKKDRKLAEEWPRDPADERKKMRKTGRYWQKNDWQKNEDRRNRKEANYFGRKIDSE